MRIQKTIPHGKGLQRHALFRKANHISGTDHYCVFSNGTVGQTWCGPTSSGLPWGAKFAGIINKPIRNNNHSQIEYYVEGKI